MRVLIAGAGIGGLSAALCLHAHGVHTRVIEAAAQLRPLGVGINLLPRAVGVLTELGLGNMLAQTGIATAANVYSDEHGHIAFSEPRGCSGGYRWPQYSIHRGRLQMLLLEAVRERLGPDAVTTDTRLLGFDQDAQHIVAQTTYGDVVADVLIGADGLHSATRAQLHPRPDPLLWSGVRTWRGATTMGRFLDGRTMAIIRDRTRAELVAYPIGEGLVNWIALVPVAEPGALPASANWNTPGDTKDVLARLGHWRPGWLDVPRLIADAERIFEYPMVDKDPLPHWGTGRVSLRGDAAHPMYPVGANGGTQAILDAHTLAAELARDHNAGLARYENIRRAATNEIITANRRMQRDCHARHHHELAAVTATYRAATGADADLPGAKS